MIWLLLACASGSDEVLDNLASENPVIREDAAMMARTVDDPAVVEALVDVLEDGAEEVRLNAVESLIELEAEEAVPALMEVVEADPSPEVQRAAVEALGRLGDPQAVPVLVAYLDARREAPPLNAIWALGNLGDPEALGILGELRSHSDVYVAHNATQALRKIRG